MAVPIGLVAAWAFIHFGMNAQLTPELTAAIVTVAAASAGLGLAASLLAIGLMGAGPDSRRQAAPGAAD